MFPVLAGINRVMSDALVNLLNVPCNYGDEPSSAPNSIKPGMSSLYHRG